MTKLQKVTVTTKGILSGNGEHHVKRLQIQIDQFLEDLERFDDAMWTLIDDSKDRLYKFLDMFVNKEDKKTNKSLEEFKTAWKRLSNSATTLSKDVQRGVKAIQPKKP